MTDPGEFITEPDGRVVVSTSSDAATNDQAPLLILEPLGRYLDELGVGEGPIQWRSIGDGHSNFTFLLRRGGMEVVLRRGPRPPFPRSTHDMLREARIQRLLAADGIAVPRILAVCDDEAVLGVPFYLMAFVEGRILVDELPTVYDTPDRRLRVGKATVDALVDLHSINVSRAPLSSIGRPDGYLVRQIERFTDIWPQVRTRELTGVLELSEWLAAHVPKAQRASVVHGDYRLGNIMLSSADEPGIAAIMDWEIATLGDPLADLGYLTATWSDPGDSRTPMELTPVTASGGFLTSEELAARYGAATGADLERLPWYQALALWKSAVFCEEIYGRWLRGEIPDDKTFAPTLDAGVPRLLEAAAEFAARL